MPIDGSRDDHFVLNLEEHSGGGYLWNINQLKESGFAIVHDDRASYDDEGIGGHVLRSVCEYAFYQAQRRSNRPPKVGARLPDMLDALRDDGQPQ